MKRFLLLLPLVVPAHAGEMRDAATNEQLHERYRQSERQDPMRQLEIVESEDPSKAVRPDDLVASSQVLCYNGTASFVPKAAVLQVPANLRSCLEFQAGAKIVPWHVFLLANRNWLTTEEVTLEQASGRAPLGEDLVKRLEKINKVTIATLGQGPISVNPYKPEESAEGEAPAAER